MLKWKDLPLEIQERMLEEQEAQGNKKGASAFMIDVTANIFEGGFDWDRSKESKDFWYEILHDNNIEHFYILYPKKESNTQVTDHLNKINKKELEQIEQKVMKKIEEINQSQYPKVMWVSNYEDFRHKCKRVVFMEKINKFLAWSTAKTLEEAEKVIDVTVWDYAKDIDTESEQLINFEDLQKDVINWANDKNLIKPENAPKQFLKVVEELGELSRSILKEDRKEEIDAFGDVMVTLIILSEQRGLNLVDCLNTAYEVIKNRKGKTVNGTFIKD
jgi:NTP pyrophosphatase (non-canonical NTP hydrolase)